MTLFRLLAASFILPAVGLAQITVSGVTDKTTYNDAVTFTIGTQAGYDYSSTLNWQPVATGVAVLVNKADFYELRVDATNQTTSAVTSQYLRFIVNDSERLGTEWGLPPHVPFPSIQSCPSEFSGAHLRILMPSKWPGGLSFPVVAWVMNEQEHPERVNGVLNARYPYLVAPAPLCPIKRGVGSGFIPVSTNADSLSIDLSLPGLDTNRFIFKESNLTWTVISGVLNGDTTWTSQSRIQIDGGITIPNGSSLTIGEGTIVLLNARADITNNGAVNINGTMENPVVLMPATNGQFWGGFVMRNSNQGIVNAMATIFTGSGANQSWFGSGGNPGSHRPEQALFFCQGGQQINLTDSAAIYLAGQLGHSVGPTTIFNATRFLMQRTTSGGEFTGARFTVNDGAFIECPDDSVNFVDGDNDALYFVDGTHFFTNTLIGWTKDDGIDSGGSGYGPLTYQSCWFEATFHEGNSLSGYKNVFARDTVYFDCGQGIEDGYNAPTGRLDHCLFSMCQAGIRHGDNYPTIGNYDGRFSGTNCISIYNHRDLFGFNWHNPGGWTNSYDRFWVSNNLVSVLDTNYPNNTLWNPANDGWRLGSLGGVGRVGVGFGVRASTLAQFMDGIPVGLSRFCSNEVQVDYVIDATDGSHRTGRLTFPAGLTRQFIPAPTNMDGVLRVALLNPTNADVTGNAVLLFQNLAAPRDSATVLSPLGANWKYWDDGSEQGAAWRAPNFDDNAWSNGVARLGFGPDQSPLGKTIRRFVQINGVDTSRQVTNFYFRRSIVVTNPADYLNMQFRYQRDDGCIVYLNGNELFRNNMPAGTVTANTFASTTVSGATAALTFYTNTVAATNFLAGANLIAVEVHQSTATSSDSGWEMELSGIRAGTGPHLNLARFGTDAVIYWSDASFGLEEADAVTGPWRFASSNSPAASLISGNRFFRLKR